MAKGRQMKLFTLLNHSLTQEQLAQIHALHIAEIIDLNLAQALESKVDSKTKSTQDSAKGLWGQIPPEIADISPLLQPYKQALQAQSSKGDYLLVQGDFGATYAMVEYAKSLGLIAIYATTLRESKEILNKDGSITKQNVFKHCIFRKY